LQTKKRVAKLERKMTKKKKKDGPGEKSLKK